MTAALSIQLNAMLYKTMQNMIASALTSQDFTYTSVTDFVPFVLYDMLEQTMPRLWIRKTAGCVASALCGLDNDANIIRYSRGELLTDIPHL